MTEDRLADLARRLKLIGVGAAAVGALLVFIAVGFLFPAVGGSRTLNVKSGWVNAPVVAVFVLVSAVVYTRLRRRHVAAALAWVNEGRAPDPQEHRLTLGLTTYFVKLDALGWSLAGVLFAVFNGLAFSWGLAAVVAATIWFGGETTCAFAFLLYERALRPVTALALAARPTGATTAPGVRLRLSMAWLLGTGVPLIGVLVLGVVGAFGWTQHPNYVGAAVLFLAILGTCTGFLATVLAAKAIAHPVRAVRVGLDRIARGELDVDVPVDDGSEVGQLQAGFNRMAEGLRERERIRDLFGRQVGQDVARAALSEGVRLGGEEREVAALFVDLVGSTSLALALPPTEVVRLLNRFFRVVVHVVEAEGGLVNKFEGDAALCVFGAPVVCQDCAGDALRAARRLAARLSHELPEVDFGIGVSAGVAVAGNVGAEHRFEYTVIGDPVNEAARLAELAKERPERVLSSSGALDMADASERQAWRVTEAAVLRGRVAPTQLAHPQLQAPAL
ncbi:MAG TPA: adenylate/guanylate cyclase domain-containing protein [Solirubrobacteraceae bacterium]|nr:adenylate/guanylate cyclase domain-containing protein [Solirubrobacteraceae bacterium]